MHVLDLLTGIIEIHDAPTLILTTFFVTMSGHDGKANSARPCLSYQSIDRSLIERLIVITNGITK